MVEVTEAMIGAGDASLIDGGEIDFTAIYLAMEAARIPAAPDDVVERVARAIAPHLPVVAGSNPDCDDQNRAQDHARFVASAALSAIPIPATGEVDHALAKMPKHTLWCVGSMEDGPFARVILPKTDGGYGRGYREARGKTPADALLAALASKSNSNNQG